MVNSELTLKQFNELTEAYHANLIAIRQKLVGLVTAGDRTAHVVSEILNSMGLEDKHLSEDGVTVDLYRNSTSKGVALLVDIDDLLQTAIGLTVISFLNSIKDRITGNLRILFQSVEDREKIIDEDAIRDMSFLLMVKNNRKISTGCAGIKIGPILLTKENFELKVFSENGHSNVIPVAAHIVTALNQLTTRKMDPLRPAEITISSSISHSSNSVEIKGSYTTSDETLARQTQSLIEQSAKGLTRAYHINYEFQNVGRSSISFNDEESSLRILNSIEEALGRDKALALEQTHNISSDLFDSQSLSISVLEVGTGSRESKDLLDAPAISAGFKALCWAFLNLA